MISVRNVTKFYGSRLAVDKVDFDVMKGNIVGFLGPNGAGKTTTMRIVTGYLLPSTGEVRVAGFDMIRDPIKARQLIGYLPETAPLYADMTVSAYLKFVARLKGLDRPSAKRRATEVIELCRLVDYRDELLGKLSRGYRQRAGLAQAIVHNPDVIVLDEPTAGIDPIQVSEFKNLIRTLAEDRTILLSTHILPDVSALCDSVIVINNGRIVAEDRIENLSAAIENGRKLRLRISGPGAEVTATLKSLNSVRAVTFDDPFHLVTYASDAEPRGEITRSIVASGWTLLEMEPVRVELDDIFLQLTRNSANPG